MIRPLRQLHRRAFIALGIFLPIAFVVGIVARNPVPAVRELPPSLSAAPIVFESVVGKRADLFVKSPIEIQLLREQKDAGRFAVKFSAPRDFIKPDLIVYRVAGNPHIADRIPDNAMLLGTFHSAALPVTDEMANANGVLVLYSLADNQVVDVTKPFRFYGTPEP
jgi:hypothetical protein